MNSKLMEVRSQNERLEKLLQMKDKEQVTGVIGEIIGFDPSNWVRGITIDKGTLDGIRSGMPVVSGNGIVGQVTVTSLNTSKILLITDHASGVDVLVQSTRLRGVVEGQGGDKCFLKYVLREDELLVGERIISSGMDGIYPKGFLIGTVSNSKRQTRAMFQSVTIEPAVNFSKLESVYVITSYSDRDKLEEQEAEEQRLLARGVAPVQSVTPVPTVAPTASPGANASKPKPGAALKPPKTPTQNAAAQNTSAQKTPAPKVTPNGTPKPTSNSTTTDGAKPTATPKPATTATPKNTATPKPLISPTAKPTSRPAPKPSPNEPEEAR